MNYNTLMNKPTINYKELIGDNTVTEVGGITEEQFNTLLNTDLASYYTKAEIVDLFSRSYVYREKSGSIVTFDCPSTAQSIPELTAEIVAVQSGTGDPSPTNVRPISGWSAVNVYRRGKNLAELSTRASATVQGITSEVKADNTIVASGKSTGNGDIICPVANPFVMKKGQTYTISLQGTDTRERQFTIFIGTAYINVGVISATDHSLTFTVVNKRLVCNQVMLRTSIGATVNINANLQIELGTTATTYEPYNGTTYTTTLIDGQGNPMVCYGGQLVNENGVQTLVLTHGYIASYNGETLPSTWISDRDVYATGTTPTIGAEVVYELETPQQIIQDTLSISSQSGTNIIWCDSGDITVKALDKILQG